MDALMALLRRTAEARRCITFPASVENDPKRRFVSTQRYTHRWRPSRDCLSGTDTEVCRYCYNLRFVLQ